MRVVPDEPIGRFGPAWRRCVGTGRMSLSLRQDWVEALRLAQAEIGFQMVRGHGLLCDDMGIHQPYDRAGHHGVGYGFRYLDQVVETYLSLGVKPFLELGFMPSALASGDQTVFWWRGNVTPPRSQAQWQDLVRAVLRHLIERYGVEEVRTWPIEVWNEPNLEQFWAGDQAEYFRLYEATARAVKEVDADLQVGGPALSPGADEWWAPFADFVAIGGVPVDFVSRHAYTSGPIRNVPFGSYQDLRPPQDMLDQFAAARRCLTGTSLADLPVHITEFNTSYCPDNPVHDTAYNAAYLAPVLAGGGELVDSFAYWTISDVFEEAGVPRSLFHGGFGLLTQGGIRKPTFHLYAFCARLGQQVLARGTDHLVTRAGDRLAVLAWHPVTGEAATPSERHSVRLSLPLAEPQLDRVFVLRRRVSESDGNAWSAWCELGRPPTPSPAQLDMLRDASRPSVEHRVLEVGSGRVELHIPLAKHEVTLVELVPVRDQTPPWLDDTRIPGYAAPSA